MKNLSDTEYTSGKIIKAFECSHGGSSSEEDYKELEFAVGLDFTEFGKEKYKGFFRGFSQDVSELARQHARKLQSKLVEDGILEE